MQPEQRSDCKNVGLGAAHISVSNPSWMNLHKCHLLAKVNKSPPQLAPSTHLIGKTQPGGICWPWNWFTGYFHGKMHVFFSFWGQTLRVGEAHKVIKSNQKFRSLTPELTAEATNTSINACSAVNGGLPGTFKNTLLCVIESLLWRYNLFFLSEKVAIKSSFWRLNIEILL